MNAIISICHFCERHGPSVVFCTQAFRDLLDVEIFGVSDQCSVPNDTEYKEDHVKKEETEVLWKYGSLDKDSFSHTKTTPVKESCVACRSFHHEQPGFISNDDGARVSYVSSQYPLQAELYLLVRQACTRSLSCEVCPEKEGPIYFGDEVRGHVLSHTFLLRDVQARGFQRWYSIMVLMKDKMLLLHSWPFLVRHLKQVITHLQDSAAKIYEEEESKVSHRALRSADSMENRRQRGVPGQPRALWELVGEQEVWRSLHSSFTWLLKASGLRLQERLVQGPSVSLAVPSTSPHHQEVSVEQIHTAMGATTFHHMLHHLLIGRQVIIRGMSEKVISSIIQGLRPLLPKHCFRAIDFSPHYVDGACCNVLGLHSGAKVPQGVLSSASLYLIDLCSTASSHEGAHKGGCTVPVPCPTHEARRASAAPPRPDQKESDTINNYTYKVTREGFLPARPPQVLSRMEAAVSNPTLSPSMTVAFLSTVVYEWMNKVKVWIHVQNMKKSSNTSLDNTPAAATKGTREGMRRSPSIPILKSPSHSLSRSPVLSTLRGLSPGGLTPNWPDPSPHDDHHQLLAALGSTEWDVPLLEFWARNFADVGSDSENSL